VRPDEDAYRVKHMLDSALAIQSFLKGRRRKLAGDDLLRSAVLRKFEVLGEAAKHVSPALRDAHPEVPWKRIIAFRNVLIHAYDRIELEPLVAAVDSLPDLVAALKRLA
jgi:uncharacterized protein with HEPN domain